MENKLRQLVILERIYGEMPTKVQEFLDRNELFPQFIVGGDQNVIYESEQRLAEVQLGEGLLSLCDNYFRMAAA